MHRSGRTARANRDGISLLLSSPEEIKQYRSLRQSLRKGKDYPEFPVDMSLLNEMRKRVNLATDIDQLEHQEEKVHTHRDTDELSIGSTKLTCRFLSGIA